jgi:hypothetical protein
MQWDTLMLAAVKRSPAAEGGSDRPPRSAFNAAATFKDMSVDELMMVYHALERILSKKIAAETAQLKKKLARLRD